MNGKGIGAAGLAAAFIAAITVGDSPAAAAPHVRTSTAATTVPAFDHVFIILMENTSASSIIGNTAQAPYINSLAAQYGYATSYYAITHPSLPNYLALTGASTFGITTDCMPSTCPVNATNIADSIEAAGKTWKAYMESMPFACDTANLSPYAVKHNPFVYFNDIRNNAARCQARDVPLTQLASDLSSASTTPNFAWITPNLCNDMHDCSIATGDSWLGSEIPGILGSPAFTLQNSVLLVTWDEDDSSGNNRVDMVVAGSQVRHGFASSVTYNHYSVLSTIESAWGLAPLNGNDGGAAVMSDFFAGVPAPVHCGSAGIAPAPFAAPPGATFALGASSTACPNPEYEFWLKGGNGAWGLQQGWGSSAYSWNTQGMAPGAYQLGVWARQAGSSASYDAYAITTGTIALDSCVSASLSPSAAPPQVQGATVAFTASSTGCGSPQYQFWVLPPGGSWTSVQAYGAGSTWSLNTSLYPAGNLQVGVWARQASSPRPYDAWFVTTFAVSPSTTCVVTGLSAGVAAPQPVGSVITFTPQQSGCSGQYLFWLLRPGGGWTAVQAYGAGSTWSWSTAGSAPGAYEVGVWEGQASSPSTYESYAITTFTLGVPTCTAAWMTPGPGSPQAAGTAVTFTATATRCTGGQFAYWLMPPGGSWTMKQAYSSSSWNWATAGLAPGVYQVGVWARQAGSTSAYDAYFISTYQLTG